MNKRKIFFFSALVLTLSVITLFVTGSSLLKKALNSYESISFGTPITWIGMISLPLTMYWGIKELRNPSSKLYSFLSGFLKIIIALGILWVPISYLLAGNLSFSEKETYQGGQDAMKWFWRLSYEIGIGAVSTLVVYWISLIFKKKYNCYQQNLKVRLCETLRLIACTVGVN